MIVWNYLRAAPLPHLTTLKSLIVGLMSGKLGMAEAMGWPGILLSLAWITALCQADALCRYQEYRRLRAMLEQRGFRAWMLRPFLGSRCQRDAALLAAYQTGYGEAAQDLMARLGYRAYHIIPEAIRRDPRTVLRSSFWRTTLIPRSWIRK